MDKVLGLLKQMTDLGIDIREQVLILDDDEPVYKDDGSRLVQDVIDIGDGRLFVERSGNNREDEALLVQLFRLLSEIEDVRD